MAGAPFAKKNWSTRLVSIFTILRKASGRSIISAIIQPPAKVTHTSRFSLKNHRDPRRKATRGAIHQVCGFICWALIVMSSESEVDFVGTAVQSNDFVGAAEQLDSEPDIATKDGLEFVQTLHWEVGNTR